MKIFLDTADPDAIRARIDSGVVDGVTTNPSKILESGRPFEATAREILELVPGDVSLEAMSPDCDGMLREARDLASWGDNAVIKLPMTKDGIKALSILSGEGIRINLTMVASQNQALLACKAGATYVSIIVGRIDATGMDGVSVVEDTVNLIGLYDFDSEVIVGSVRTPSHVQQCAQVGAHVTTMAPPIFDQLYEHPLTDSGIAQFEADWAQATK
jgi:transaldolase